LAKRFFFSTNTAWTSYVLYFYWLSVSIVLTCFTRMAPAWRDGSGNLYIIKMKVRPLLLCPCPCERFPANSTSRISHNDLPTCSQRKMFSCNRLPAPLVGSLWQCRPDTVPLKVPWRIEGNVQRNDVGNLGKLCISAGWRSEWLVLLGTYWFPMSLAKCLLFLLYFLHLLQYDNNSMMFWFSQAVSEKRKWKEKELVPAFH
jgi:hypothetical protein